MHVSAPTHALKLHMRTEGKLNSTSRRMTSVWRAVRDSLPSTTQLSYTGEAMCQVVNRYKVNMNDPDIVYIGRGSIWGNPHIMKTEADRESVVAAYRQTLWSKIVAGSITKEMLIALDGKRLACYCAPKSCHGDVLLAVIKWSKGVHSVQS